MRTIAEVKVMKTDGRVWGKHTQSTAWVTEGESLEWREARRPDARALTHKHTRRRNEIMMDWERGQEGGK